jgi:hypothetical protein
VIRIYLFLLSVLSVDKNISMERIRTFSINLPFPLYERLLGKAGKGRVSTFIKKLVEKELGDNEKKLLQEYKEAYRNPRLLKLAKK